MADNDLVQSIISSIDQIDPFGREKYLKGGNIDENNIIDSSIITKGIEELIGKELKCKFLFQDNLSILILQALRLSALFHDIGHLPFSHLGEYALLGFLKKVKKGNEELEQLFREINPKPHEIIGEKLVDLIFCYLMEKRKERNNPVFSYVTLKVIYEIYKKIENDEFVELHKLISSDLDADRLDYVIRDGYASGIYNRSFDIDRIIKTFCLVKDRDIFKILPSMKALFDINRFYFDRFNLYRTVINHHKVKRFDFILQLSIEQILEKEFKRVGELKCKDTININRLIDMVCVINQLINFKKSTQEEIERIFFKFTQLTDFWLLNIIQQKVIEAIDTSDEFELFNEILTGTKVIKSLYKRISEASDYFNFDEKMLLLQDFFNNIDNIIFIAKTKEAEYPDELEIYDPANMKTQPYSLADYFNINNKPNGLFVYYNSNNISGPKEVVSKIKEKLGEPKDV